MRHSFQALSARLQKLTGIRWPSGNGRSIFSPHDAIVVEVCCECCECCVYGVSVVSAMCGVSVVRVVSVVCGVL